MRGVPPTCIYAMSRLVSNDGNCVMIDVTSDLHVAEKFVRVLQSSSWHMSQSIRTVRRIYFKQKAHIIILLVIRLTFNEF